MFSFFIKKNEYIFKDELFWTQSPNNNQLNPNDEIDVTPIQFKRKSIHRSDQKITQTALNALAWNYSIPKNVKVYVKDGWLTLRGEVDWEYQKNSALNSVIQLLGVNGVSNDIIVKQKNEFLIF